MTATTPGGSRTALQNEFNQLGSRLVRFGQAMWLNRRVEQMAKTVLGVRFGATSFYLDTESSSPGTGHRNRYRLFKTDNYGRDKLGWIQVGSMAGQELAALDTDRARFEACEKLFSSKKPHQYGQYGDIRGQPGKWEGEAFPLRVANRP